MRNCGVDFKMTRHRVGPAGGSLVAAAGVLLVAATMLFASAESARAEISYTEALPGGVQRTTYRIGPIDVTSGQNRINFRPIVGASRPNVDGWITRIRPDLVYENGTVPKSSLVMFHHGVWINFSTGENFYATGEEKTILDLPDGFGYRYEKDDHWIFNDMIHNLTPTPMKLYVEYEIDFIPDSAPEADDITRAYPIWMDVQNGIYPVFDVWRDSGGKDGKFTYPQDDPDAYPEGFHLNLHRMREDGMLIGTTGHVHTGGLSTNLYLRRAGASYAGPSCPARVSYEARLKPPRNKHLKFRSRIKRIRKQNAKLARIQRKIRRVVMRRGTTAKMKRHFHRIKRRKKVNLKRVRRINRPKAANLRRLNRVRALDRAERRRYARCRATQPRVNDGNRVHLFNSKTKYFDPRGPVSWDMAMFSTGENWRVRVEKGDLLEIQTTYDTTRASWPESMGINIVYWVPDSELPAAANTPNPYVKRVDTEGVLNHGHLEENEDYGGKMPVVGPDPRKLPDGKFGGGPFTISNYLYRGADFRLPGARGRPPVVREGQSFTFKLSDYDIRNEIWHSLTSCKAPCNRSTGISYPIPNGKFQFESGQMGIGGPPTVGYTEWSTPKTLPEGTYTFFCRIHPLMRGAFRVN